MNEAETILKSKNIKKCRQRQSAVFFLATIITILAIISVIAIAKDTINRFQMEYEKIDVTVTDTYEEQTSSRAGRAQLPKSVPIADVRLADGSIKSMENENLKIGDQVTVYQSSLDGSVSLQMPSKPGFVEGITTIAILLFGGLAFFFAKDTRSKLKMLKNKQLNTSLQLKLKIEKQVRTNLFAEVMESDFLSLPAKTNLKITLENGQKAGHFSGEVNGFIADAKGIAPPYHIFIKDENKWFFAAAEPIEQK